MTAMAILPLGPGEEELLLGAGYANIKQSLFLRQLSFFLSVEPWKSAFLHSRQEYVIKLAALGLMYRDNGNLRPLIQRLQFRIG